MDAAGDSASAGLSSEEARRRLALDGPNEVAGEQPRSVLRIVAEALREPMFVLLMGASGLYLLVGDLTEGLALTVGAALTVGLVVVQEARSERSLAALRALAQPSARVMRDGDLVHLPGRELVKGDAIHLIEGDRVPADAALVSGDVLSLDESLLTGESATVRKAPDLHGARHDHESVVFAGTLVTRGQGVARVMATGARSAIGRIGVSLARIGHEPTPLQASSARLIRWVGAAALAFCALVAVLYGVLKGEWFEGALTGVTLAIALIPEEFPMVLAIFMALGAWRLARHGVLVRRGAVIESLGAATVLCVDKTGTLTENRMSLVRLHADGLDLPAGDASWKAAHEDLLRYALLASAPQPIDPMDRAVQRLAGDRGAAVEPSCSLVRSWPIRPQRLAVVQAWRMPEGMVLAAKGAPEHIYRLCRLQPEDMQALQSVIARWAEDGLRVLGVAAGRVDAAFGGDPDDVLFRFVGLCGFADPVRTDASEALEEARAAGIRVMMITGDHAATGLAVGRQVGLDVTGGALSGAEIAGLPLVELRRRLEPVSVCARVLPEQKLQIIEALKQDGEIVAMTGDGVNDAPALKAAHIGIAMGRKGTDVAREAADLVILDDSLASIVGGVRLGRRIFTNLQQALVYITAVHVPIAGLALAPILLGLPPMLFPLHIVLLELLIDPLCALVFESAPSGPEAMRRPPRPARSSLFGLRQVRSAMLQGAILFAGVLSIYVWGLQSFEESQARAAAFLAMTLGVLVLALADSSRSGRLFTWRRQVFWFIAAVVVLVLSAVMSSTLARDAFQFGVPSLELFGAAAGTALAAGGWPALLLRGDASGGIRPNRNTAR